MAVKISIIQKSCMVTVRAKFKIMSPRSKIVCVVSLLR